MIRNPQVTLYSQDLPTALAFYQNLGFSEAFRFPEEGPYDWLDDFRDAWAADPDGNPIQLVSRRWG